MSYIFHDSKIAPAKAHPHGIALVHTVSQKFTAKIGKTSIKPQEKQKNSQKIP